MKEATGCDARTQQVVALMARWLVTGAAGMLGQDLCRVSSGRGTR